jgi:hypothetical protein
LSLKTVTVPFNVEDHNPVRQKANKGIAVPDILQRTPPRGLDDGNPVLDPCASIRMGLGELIEPISPDEQHSAFLLFPFGDHIRLFPNMEH